MDVKSSGVAGLMVSLESIKFIHLLFKHCTDESNDEQHTDTEQDNRHDCKDDRHDQRDDRHDEEAAYGQHHHKHDTCKDELEKAHDDTPGILSISAGVTLRYFDLVNG